MEDQTILVTTTQTGVRGRTPKELDLEVLADNVFLFLSQMNIIIEKTPDNIGDFALVEFSIAAEISAKGQLVLLGVGGEVGAQGGLTFKFERQPKRSK